MHCTECKQYEQCQQCLGGGATSISDGIFLNVDLLNKYVSLVPSRPSLEYFQPFPNRPLGQRLVAKVGIILLCCRFLRITMMRIICWIISIHIIQENLFVVFFIVKIISFSKKISKPVNNLDIPEYVVIDVNKYYWWGKSYWYWKCYTFNI